MAATPSTSTSIPRGRIGQDIHACFVDTNPPFSSALPIILRFFYNPARKAALFRLRATVGALAYFLEISPDKIQSLSLHPGPPAYLDFRVAAINFIAPRGPLLRPTVDTDRSTLEALRLLAQQSTLRVSLPDVMDNMTQLATLCEAVARGGLCPDLEQSELKMLYGGRGGRVVPAEEVWTPASFSSTEEAPDNNLLPPPNLFSTVPGESPLLPAYTDLASPPPPPPLSPRPPTRKKRRRTRTPSFSSSSSPDYRTWKHLDLAIGDREKIMSELLRRAEHKEKTFKKVMGDLDAKCARAEEAIARLTALIPPAQERGPSPALCEAGGPLHMQLLQERQVPAAEEDPRASQISTASASPTSAASTAAASVSSNISDRVQAYITAQLDQLRDELASDYATHESVEQRVSDEVDRTLHRYVEEYQMFDAIREAIDKAMEEVRARMLEAWQ